MCVGEYLEINALENKIFIAIHVEAISRTSATVQIGT